MKDEITLSENEFHSLVTVAEELSETEDEYNQQLVSAIASYFGVVESITPWGSKVVKFQGSWWTIVKLDYEVSQQIDGALLSCPVGDDLTQEEHWSDVSDLSDMRVIDLMTLNRMLHRKMGYVVEFKHHWEGTISVKKTKKE